MPTPTKGPRLGGSPAHERLMLANLATALFEHDRITTTETKAKRLRPLAEKLITFAKRGDLHARRQVMTVIRDKDVVHKMFTEIGPSFSERAGGYTRITKVGPRKGDNAPMAVIELVEALTAAQSAVREGERARGTKSTARRAPTGRTAEIAADAAAQSPTAAGVAAEAAQAGTDDAVTDDAVTDDAVTYDAVTDDAVPDDAVTDDAVSADAFTDTAAGSDPDTASDTATDTGTDAGTDTGTDAGTGTRTDAATGTAGADTDRGTGAVPPAGGATALDRDESGGAQP